MFLQQFYDSIQSFFLEECWQFCGLASFPSNFHFSEWQAKADTVQNFLKRYYPVSFVSHSLTIVTHLAPASKYFFSENPLWRIYLNQYNIWSPPGSSCFYLLFFKDKKRIWRVEHIVHICFLDLFHCAVMNSATLE